MFSIFDCRTHERVSDEVYSTAEEANHDYHMNYGKTYIGMTSTQSTQTSILTLCRCGWIGVTSSSQSALQGWHDHAFNSRGGMHERVGEMAVSNPLNALGMARVGKEAAEMARLARWKGYRESQGPLRMEDDTLELAEMRLKRGALTALAMVLGLVGIVLMVMGIWRTF